MQMNTSQSNTEKQITILMVKLVVGFKRVGERELKLIDPLQPARCCLNHSQKG